MRRDRETLILWDVLIEEELFTYDELRLLTDINGYSVKTLNSALYARYGYRDIKQMIENGGIKK